MTFEILFYAVIVIAALFYVALDGFDLGVGCLHLFAHNDQERRLFLNSIGPFWDGNEVWIVIVVGGLFAGFPNAYATVLSSFYLLSMFLLMSLIFRAVAIEFRSKRESPKWRQTWDVVFSLASIAIAFGLGVLLGNLVQGIPLNHEQNFIGTFSDFFRPYSLLIGLTTLALFTMHGAIYLTMKTEGDLCNKVRRWIGPALFSFLVLYAITTFATLIYLPHMSQFFLHHPSSFIVPILALLAIISIPYQVRRKREGWAFVSSCASIAMLLLLFALGTFPHLIMSTVDPEINSVTIHNAASSHKTLGVLLLIVVIGIPLVLAYGFWVYRVFRGKVKLDPTSY